LSTIQDLEVAFDAALTHVERLLAGGMKTMDGDSAKPQLERLDKGLHPGRGHILYSTMRRFVGILTGICALYLTVGAVDAPCVDHGRGSSSESGVAVMSHHDGSHHELPTQKSDQPKPCKTAAIPCCVAMTSCGTTIALGAGVTPNAFQTEAQIVPACHLAQPLSRIAAPEPPPPKA
jgi:hypothetical protein